jgi:hypothetical protein
MMRSEMRLPIVIRAPGEKRGLLVRDHEERVICTESRLSARHLRTCSIGL